MPTQPPSSEPRARFHTFHFGPFRIESELDLPELHGSRGPGETPVTIHIGGVPAAIEDAEQYGKFCQLTRTEYLLNIPDTARYYVRDGKDVRVEIAPGAPLANVTLYLLGSVFGVLCHQNGLLPLHASAIAHQGKVHAFLGDSGAGKSTLAACLQRRGHRIVSDDICLLDLRANSLRVIPVAGWLKLWNRSFEYLGQSPVEAHRVFSTDDKYRLYVDAPAPAPAETLSLDRVIFLSRNPDASAPPRLEPLPAPEAIAALMDTVYVAYVAELSGEQPRIFRDCARILAQARAFRLTIPWDLDRMEAVLDLVEREILSGGPSRPDSLAAGPSAPPATG